MATGTANGAATQAAGDAAGDAAIPASWRELRADGDIQFAPVEIPEIPPPEKTWIDRFFEWLGELIRPLGELFGGSWPVVRWVLLALLIVAVLFIIHRLLGDRLALRRPADHTEEEETHWAPAQQEALALLADADRLAAEGKFDAATHLLLQRSVGQIAQRRPDLVEPSTTARELASMASLPGNARQAFGVIVQRVERSLFALRSLNAADWEAARAAYAEFALARIDRPA